MPWPTNARTTPKPWLSQCGCTACETSPSRLPGAALHDGLVQALAGDVEQLLHAAAAPRPTGRVIAQSA